MGDDSQDFGREFLRRMRLWEICEDLRDFGRGFERICETLGEDSQDFGGESVRSHESLGEDSQGIVKLWERICRDS